MAIDAPELLQIVQVTKDYPKLKPLHDKAMKELEKLAAETQKVLDKEMKEEAEAKAKAEADAAAKAKEEAEKEEAANQPSKTKPKYQDDEPIRRENF